MKLIIAIIQDEHANKVIRELTDSKFRVTKLASTGGFLKSGNTTLLIGSEDDKINLVEEIFRKNSSDKNVELDKKEVNVSANLFIVPVEDYRKF
ncbi:hypothetical protein E8P77_03140 [Soehngenia saccharolytica]|nr:hypothetical protein E8P77_03140 [Soehngenia saccharolytica]